MSELGIARQNVASANVQSQLGAEVQQANRGERKGDAATAIPKNSDLSDIQEEIGNAVGKFADKKTLGQAKIRQGAGVNIEALTRIAEYYDKLPDMPREAELRNLVSQLQGFEDLLSGGGGKSPTADDILEALRDFDGDVTHQYGALQIARRYFEETDASPEFQALLNEAERSFDDPDIKRDIAAGYAIAEAASEKAPTLETAPGALRDTYREMLRGNKDMGQLFDQLSGFNIRLHFNEVIDLFLDTAGRELANADSQIDPVILGGLVKELSALKEMRTVYEEGDRLIGQVQRIDPSFAPDSAQSSTALTSALLNYCAKTSPSLSDARRLVEGFEPASEQTMVVFANGLHDMHRLISDRSVASNPARLQQSTMLQNLQIELSAKEEAAFSATAQ
ncbi:HrpJ domain-containing protein [Yoonia sp. BS5-3]|uniref:HrpJ domain-containing protein n=1 Tax=Yoonia phaeophyticola TaxID=3137369 RepID=A0ABZ2V3Y4_9RHOB